MIKIVLNGIFGRMGQEVLSAVRERDDFTVVGGVDPLTAPPDSGIDVTARPLDVVPRCDAVIEALAD